MRMYDLIMKKRKGEELTKEEINLFCRRVYKWKYTRLSSISNAYGYIFQ